VASSDPGWFEGADQMCVLPDHRGQRGQVGVVKEGEVGFQSSRAGHLEFADQVAGVTQAGSKFLVQSCGVQVGGKPGPHVCVLGGQAPPSGVAVLTGGNEAAVGVDEGQIQPGQLRADIVAEVAADDVV